MKAAQLRSLGIPGGVVIGVAQNGIKKAMEKGFKSEALEDAIQAVAESPERFINDELWGDLAAKIVEVSEARARFTGRKASAPWHQWGDGLDSGAIQQMKNACNLPISVAGALMPDAHKGYGLPIGGVLATENAVIPYAVGMDIACRMKLSVLDIPVSAIEERREELIQAIEAETRFGVGAGFKPSRSHPIMDDPAWHEVPVLKGLYEKASVQLGTSGSGNHFVEFGVLDVFSDDMGLPPGKYVALMSHSGSRGTGEGVAKHYSALAMKMHRELPEELLHLAWLDMDGAEGQEYWRAMTLMGQYSAANHRLVHDNVLGHLGINVLAGVENHHNFAWKEELDGREVIIHRKGATPAAEGVIGVIPGSMATSAYIVKGKGNPLSLNSAAHGAGRAMSRVEAENRFSREDIDAALKEGGVHLISAGIDEAPMAYKDIEEVMDAQEDLVERVGCFAPKLVKMAPPGKLPSWRRKMKKKRKKK